MDELQIETLNKERQRYVDYFIETIDSFKKVKGVTFASELLIRIDDQTIPEPFDLTRVDLIYKNERGEPIINELRLDNNLTYDKLEFKMNGSRIMIKPFCWNSCEMTTDKLDTEELTKWIRKCLKVEDETNGQISEAIHNCTLPQTMGGKNTFTVDLGTSTKATLIELIDSLTKTGTKEISIETSVV